MPELHAEPGAWPVAVQPGEVDRSGLGVDFGERPRGESRHHRADFRGNLGDAAVEGHVEALHGTAELEPGAHRIVFVAQRESDRGGDRAGLHENRVAQLEPLEQAIALRAELQGDALDVGVVDAQAERNLRRHGRLAVGRAGRERDLERFRAQLAHARPRAEERQELQPHHALAQVYARLFVLEPDRPELDVARERAPRSPSSLSLPCSALGERRGPSQAGVGVEQPACCGEDQANEERENCKQPLHQKVNPTEKCSRHDDTACP